MGRVPHGFVALGLLGLVRMLPEIALLRDVPRVATCSARTDGEL